MRPSAGYWTERLGSKPGAGHSSWIMAHTEVALLAEEIRDLFSLLMVPSLDPLGRCSPMQTYARRRVIAILALLRLRYDSTVMRVFIARVREVAGLDNEEW